MIRPGKPERTALRLSFSMNAAEKAASIRSAFPSSDFPPVSHPDPMGFLFLVLKIPNCQNKTKYYKNFRTFYGAIQTILP